jgi:hypothetical protein
VLTLIQWIKLVSPSEHIIQGVYKSNFNFYRQVNDNQAFKEALFSWLFEKYLENRASHQSDRRAFRCKRQTQQDHN